MRRLALAFAFVPLFVAAVAAQNPPRRPRLARDADTNDARAYFQLGMQRVEVNPGQAADAFYWAARLDPNSPQTLYARGIALLLRNPPRLVRYRERDPATLENPDVRAIDSLRFRAEMQDPFFHRGMDQLLLYAYARAAVRNEEWFGRSESAGRSGIVQFIERFFEETDQYGRGQLYYSDNQLREALQYWALAMRMQSRRVHLPWLWSDRARAWYELRQLDSARVALDSAIHLLDLVGGGPTGYVHENRSAWLYALGRIHEDRRDLEAARAAYQRAIDRDVTYYPTWLRLGVLAGVARDTATAITYLAQATSRPGVQFFALAAAATAYGALGRNDSAVVLLRRATQTEPWASAGWLLYARALDATGNGTAALAAYERYIALAPRTDTGVLAVTPRVQVLRAAAGRP